MKAVVSTTDRALVETLRIALESEGIAVTLDQESGAAPFIPVTVLVPDSAYSQAVEVAKEFAPPALSITNDQTRSRRVWRVVLLAIVIVTIIVCGTILIG